MRFLSSLLVAACVAILMGDFARAEVIILVQGEALQGEGLAVGQQPTSIDDLLRQLRRTSDADAAVKIERRIWRRWTVSGSDTVDLLLTWANAAEGRGRISEALDLLDRVIVLKPTFAHGWNRRAIIHYSKGDLARSLDDIQRVIALEPNHFGAYSGLGAILVELGRTQHALDAFMRVLEIYPAHKRAREAVIQLIEELDGQSA